MPDINSPKLLLMNNKFPRVLALIVVVLFAAQSCRGRAAHPVKVVHSEDKQVTCKAIQREAKQITREVRAMMPIIKKKDTHRGYLMMAGALLIVPWFFLDLTDPEKIEANALRRRYNHLADLAGKRKCGFKIPRLKKFDFDHLGYERGGR